jgi:hypothetical protein
MLKCWENYFKNHEWGGGGGKGIKKPLNIYWLITM